jgi:hypothetical protein
MTNTTVESGCRMGRWGKPQLANRRSRQYRPLILFHQWNIASNGMEFAEWYRGLSDPQQAVSGAGLLLMEQGPPRTHA